MAAHIVYNNVPPRQGDQNNESDGTQKLFSGQKLWFSHAVPQRRWLMENARLNGATVVDRDVDADIKLVDHARKNQAPGTHSYKYVELSIRNSALENLADHAVGVSTRVARPVGSTVTAPRGGRVPYTEEDDQFLWDWMKPFEDNGGAYKGNEIYKQIEQVNPRHTYQSWRDRWIKNTRFQKRQVRTTAQGPEPTPQLAADGVGQAARDPTPLRARIPERAQTSEQLLPPSKTRRQDRGERVDTGVQLGHDTIFQERRGPDHVVHPATTEARAGVDPAEEVQRAIVQPSDQAEQLEPRDEEEDHGEMDDMELSDLSPSNVPGGFNIKEYKELYQMVPKLTEMTLDEGVWEELAASSEYAGHKPEQWKYFFEYRVVPDYCRNKNLKLEDVASYLFKPQESNSADEQHRAAEQNEQDDLPGTKTNSGLFVCTNCYSNDSDVWRHDKEGKLLCNECAVFLRIHGVPRPSTMGLEAIAEQTENSATHPQTPSRPISHQKFTITPVIGSIEVFPRAFPADADLAEAVYARSPLRSPSFRPQSPTLSRIPVPNEARKRSAGRNTQSQSQSQSQTQSHTQSQPTEELDQSSSQRHTQIGSEAHASEMGEAQSKETLPNDQPDAKSQNPNAAVPSFRFATTGARPRRRLQDDPDNLDIQQDSSLSTDKGPPREPPAIHSAESDEEGFPPPFPHQHPAQRQRSSQGPSPLFVSEDDYGNEEEEDSVEIKQERLPTPEDDQMNSRMNISPVNEAQSRTKGGYASLDLSGHDSGAEGSDLEPMDLRESSPELGTGGYARRQRQQASEEPQSIRQGNTQNLADADDADGNDAVPKARHELPSEIPLQSLESDSEHMDQWETAPEHRQNMQKRDRLSTQALFDSPNIPEALHLDLEVPDPEGGWDSVLGPGAADALEPENSGTLSIENTPQRQPAPPAWELEKDGGIKAGGNTDLHPSPRPVSTVPAEAQAAHQTAEDEATTDKWLAYEESLHPDVENLMPICIRALECTSIHFDRASDVVEVMLEQLKRKRRRTARSEFIAVNEVDIPQDMQGVWTEEDDHLLMGESEEGVRRIVAKHGRTNCDRRFNFLYEYVEN